jgi:hypothetical protein
MHALALRAIPLAEQPDAYVLTMRAMALLRQMPEVLSLYEKEQKEQL